jgi:PAS domain S-box-containing protein
MLVGTKVKSLASLENLSPEEGRLMLHELRVHQIELEMQNDELRRVQEELGTSRGRYFDFFDLAPVGFCTLSKQGLIVEANLFASTLFGEARGALLRQPISRFILKEDQDFFYLQRKRIFESIEAKSFDLRMMTADGSEFWVYLVASIAPDTVGAAAVLRLVILDITERKVAQLQAEHDLSVLELLATGSPLPDVLARLLTGYEALCPGLRTSLLLLDPGGRNLCAVAGPNLPPGYRQAIGRVDACPELDSLGIPAPMGSTMPAADITRNSQWKGFKELALAHDLHACLAVPIPSAAAGILGVLAVYFDRPRAPLPLELSAVERAARLAGLAISSRSPQGSS